MDAANPDANLDSMVISPIMDNDGRIRFLHVAFQGSPGFSIALSRAAAIELRDFLAGIDGLR